MGGADLFRTVGGGALKPEMIKAMAADPSVALPIPPEIRPELALEFAPTRSSARAALDYPNQVNNVLCFPFIFRGALDVGATTINEHEARRSGPLPSWRRRKRPISLPTPRRSISRFRPRLSHSAPTDPRLIERIAPAVAKAAMDSGVATVRCPV
jgi:malate dehydrogenase (oxaloacetate-decarboxylating)(NADP+)